MAIEAPEGIPKVAQPEPLVSSPVDPFQIRLQEEQRGKNAAALVKKGL